MGGNMESRDMESRNMDSQRKGTAGTEKAAEIKTAVNTERMDQENEMRKITRMELIRIYLAQFKGPFGLFLLFCGIFGAVFYLYRLPVEAVLYGLALCSVLSLIIVVINYRRFAKEYRMLERILSELWTEPAGFYLEELPAAHSVREKEYQRLIFMLCEKMKRMNGEFESAKGDMTDYYTMWVHQIKTPISAMRLLLQTGEEGEEEMARKDGELAEQLFKIEEYVNMVLQYLRLDGGSDLILNMCSLDDIVRQAVRKYAGMFVRRRLSLSYEPLDCRVLTDEKWLVFVIEQILSNAIKYTRQGGISIYMEEGENKTLVISDTGIGIAPEDQPRIFEKGFTGYNGHSDKKSTGIGLYLCSRILNRLSHTVSVESEPGKGTRIRINLDTVRIEVE